MEAIVLGVKNGRAALLLEDGTTTYRYMECRPGQRVEVPEKVGVVRSMPRAARTAAAAAALALVVSGGTLYATALPVSYVTEDVNPSMEYRLNRMDRVIGVTALNEDAEAVVGDLAVSGGTIQEAVDAAGKRMEAEGVLKEDGYVLFSVTSDSDRHAKKLENELTAMMDEKERDGLTFSVLHVSEDEHRAAEKLDMSAGRYKEMLNEKGETAASDKRLISEFQNKSVREMLGGSDETKEKEDAVQAADRKKNATKQNVKKSEKNGTSTDSSTADTKREAEKEETQEVTQDQPTTQSSTSTQSKPADPPADNPQPVAPTPAPESQPQPQPQPENGSGNDAPAADPQPSDAPQETQKEEKQKESGEKAEPKKESEGSNKAEPERDAEPPSNDFGSDDGPSGGGEPPGGGGPGGPP